MKCFLIKLCALHMNASTEKAFFGCFWAFVGQPHGHIHWATSMPFVSFNPTNPRTNLRNFREKILRIGDFEKWAFFESAILNFFFEKKKKFASFPWWVKILMFSLVSRKFLAMRNIVLYSVIQYALDLRKILGVAKKFLKSRSFLFQTLQNP